MGLTAITFGVNDTTKNVTIKCYHHPDHKGNDATIKPNDTAGPPDLNMWIPWATSQEDMNNGMYIKLTVEINNKEYYLYQDGSSVRYSNDTIWKANAPAVPGYGSIDGNRTVVIYKAGTWELDRSS